ncbi:hypothetical protein REPUB_Repub03eG0197600 [Reevesia pubescens]
MSSSEGFPSKDAQQWSQDEDYSDLMHVSSDQNQQQHPLLGNENHPQESYENSNHPQQQQIPVIVTSSQGYLPAKDDSSLNHQSFYSFQQSEQEYLSESQSIYHPKQQQHSIGTTSLEGLPLKDENCYQPQQLLPSVGTCSPPKDHEQSYPTGYHNSSHSPIPMTEHSNTSSVQSPSTKATSAQDPSKDPNPVNYNNPPPDLEEYEKAYPENIAVPKAETFHKNVCSKS